jgi:hypothetical protein
MKIDHWENPCVVLCGMNTSWKRAYFRKVLRSLPRELWTRTSSFVKNKNKECFYFTFECFYLKTMIDV